MLIANEENSFWQSSWRTHPELEERPIQDFQHFSCIRCTRNLLITRNACECLAGLASLGCVGYLAYVASQLQQNYDITKITEKKIPPEIFICAISLIALVLGKIGTKLLISQCRQAIRQGYEAEAEPLPLN